MHDKVPLSVRALKAEVRAVAGPASRSSGGGRLLLKQFAKDAATVVVVLVCTVVAVAVLFNVVYSLMLLAGWLATGQGG